MPRFHLTGPAARDLQEILSYIRKRNPQAAKRVKKQFRIAMSKLTAMPHIGHFREDVTDKRFRFWCVYSYLIAYRPETKPLEITRILHGAQSLSRFFEDV
jgi:toxin ParE1/3/4